MSADGRPGFGVPGYEHCRIVTVTMHQDVLARIDAMVAELKARGETKASRSGVLRAAFERFAIDDYPRSA